MGGTVEGRKELQLQEPDTLRIVRLEEEAGRGNLP